MFHTQRIFREPTAGALRHPSDTTSLDGSAMPSGYQRIDREGIRPRLHQHQRDRPLCALSVADRVHPTSDYTVISEQAVVEVFMGYNGLPKMRVKVCDRMDYLKIRVYKSKIYDNKNKKKSR